MHPILFKIGPFNIFSYGVMVALGFSLACLCIYIRAPRYGIKRDEVVDLTIIMLISGLIGARIFYVVQHLAYYRANPWEIPDLSRGGLVWYGAFILGLASSLVYMRMKRIDILQALDLAAPYIALAQAVGRMGCFLNGCCYGLEAPDRFPPAVYAAYDGCMRHPTQLYSAVMLLAIFVVLRIWHELRRFKGEIFLGYCMLYSVKRFAVEFLRGDVPRVFFDLTLAQLISAALFMAAASLFVYHHAALSWKKR